MWDKTCDVVVIGSGAGGAVAAQRLTEQGAKVILLEAGSLVKPEEHNTAFWSSMKHLFWDSGFQYAPGTPTIPFLQGRAVGGTTVINSAICWDLPEDIHQEWIDAHAFEIDYADIDLEQQRIRKEINIHEVPPEIAGGNNNVMQRGAERLGWSGRIIARNEKDCQGSGRCLLGCPNGAKLSMDVTYVPWAQEKGMELIPDCPVDRVLIKQGRVIGVEAELLDFNKRSRWSRRPTGRRLRIKTKAVVVAAGVIQSPQILQRSNVIDPWRLIGTHLMAHPGISMVGCYDEVVNIWNGATQGYEVNEFRPQGLKLESLGVSPALFGMRLPGVGARFMEYYEKRAHMAMWAAAIRTEALGSVRVGRPISPIRFSLNENDVKKFLMGVRVTGEMMFAGGAREVYPGIEGRAEKVFSTEELRAVTEAPIRPTDIHPVATHLFGTCRMSADPMQGVIDSNFESHTTKGLFVADGSVFPTNTGVNPQLAIMALAGVAARRVATSL
jgi:choline dehydrogenase-like flavoprotein